MLRPDAEPPADPPPFDEPTEAAAGIMCLRLRLPFALNHVNLWLCDDGDGWTIIDTGYGDAPTRAVWTGLLGGRLAGRPVRRLLVTHFHPDHFGLAGWLGERTGAELWMTRTEWLTGRMLVFDQSGATLAQQERRQVAAGLPASVVERQRARGHAYRRGVSEPPAGYRRLQAGETIRLAGSDWRVIVGEGHAPEQATLFSAERNLLIAADQVLPRISPVIGVWSSEPDADPLADYLRSLAPYRALPEDCRVLPSHGVAFSGLHARLAELAAHPAERLEETRAACREPATAHAVLQRLFRRELDAQQTVFALGETLAHLNHLVHRGEIRRAATVGGVLVYAAA